MPLRSYSGTAKRTALTGDITAASTTFTVSDATGYPAPTGGQGPFVVTLGLGMAGEEKLLIASRSGNTFTVSQRGFDGTAATAHGAGRTVDHTLSATDVREVNEFVNGTGFVSTAGGSTITSSGAAVKGLVVKGATGQTANLAEFQNDAGGILARVTATGKVVSEVQGLFGPGAAGNFGTGLAGIGVQPQAANGQGLVVRGVTGQTANLAEFQNSAGTVLSGTNAGGALFFDASLSTATATAGGGQATPATVAGYIAVAVAGVTRRIPYYAT